MRFTPRGRQVVLNTGRIDERPVITHSRGRVLPSNPPEFFRELQLVKAFYKAGRDLTLGSTMRASGTTPPVVQISGTPRGLLAPHIRVNDVSGGTGLGQAKFDWSMDNGTTYEATGVTTAASVVLGTTGITAAFAAGPYNADNVYEPTVSAWNDQSGNGLHLVQATAATQPVFLLRDTRFNRAPSLRFDGAQRMAVAWSAISHPYTFMCTAHFTATASNCVMGSNGLAVIMQGAGVNTFQYFAGSIISMTNVFINTTKVFIGVFNTTSSVGRIGATEQTGDTGSGQSNGLTLGATASGVNFFQGAVSEVAVFSTALPAYARDALHGYSVEAFGAAA